MTLIGNIKSSELSLMLPSLVSIIRKLDFKTNWSGSSNTLRLPACCMNQDIHKGLSIYYVSREGEGGGYPKMNVVSEVA